MSKKPLKYYFFSILFSYLLIFLSSALFMGCAPKVIAPPPLYKNKDLSLEDVIAIAQGDINTLKAIISIKVEKDYKQYSYVDASVLFKRPNWLHMRFYKFGLPVGNYIIKDSIIQVISGRGTNKFKEFGKELYYSVFWWDDLKNAFMYKQEGNYIIRAENKEIRLDKSTLLPEKQEIMVNNEKIYIFYDEPKKESTPASQDDFWYPSSIRIEIGAYRFNVKIKKLFVNPLLKDGDFREPEERI